ncbi:hypothetical protein Dimus_013977 [Dionaea muscipula]
MGEVILGLPGGWANNTSEASDHYTTKIGGRPDWPFPEANLRQHLLRCNSCGSDLCLIAQVYAPLPGVNSKIEERVIYIFGCAGLHCGSWRAIRVQKSDSSVVSKVAQQAPSNVISKDDLFSFGSEEVDDFNDNEDMELEELGRALSQAGSLASGSMRQNVKKNSETSQNRSFMEGADNNLVLPCFYIYTEPEKCKDVMSICSSYSSLSIKEKVNDDNNQSDEEVWEQEGYEYDRALNADRTYLKFKKRIDAYPDQCLRYSYGGTPLLATRELGDPGMCGVCGGSRLYEMQLMPSLLYFLQEPAAGGQNALLDNWNWMTLLVYTCEKSCFKKTDQDSCGWTVAEEAVVAQYEKPLNESAQLGFFL